MAAHKVFFNGGDCRRVLGLGDPGAQRALTRARGVLINGRVFSQPHRRNLITRCYLTCAFMPTSRPRVRKLSAARCASEFRLVSWMVLCHVFCHMQMLERLLKGHVTEWAREGGWRGVRIVNDDIRHCAIRGPGGVGERGLGWVGKKD